MGEKDEGKAEVKTMCEVAERLKNKGKRYSCTRTKLGKLLSILAFSYERNSISLFEEKIYEYPQGCGTLIKDLTFIPEEYIIKIHRDIKIINVIKDIEDVFRRFGAYSGSQLADCLNPIVNKIKIENSDELDLSILRLLKKSEFGLEEKMK